MRKALVLHAAPCDETGGVTSLCTPQERGPSPALQVLCFFFCVWIHLLAVTLPYELQTVLVAWLFLVKAWSGVQGVAGWGEWYSLSPDQEYFGPHKRCGSRDS